MTPDKQERPATCACWYRDGERKGWTSDDPCPIHPDERNPRDKLRKKPAPPHQAGEQVERLTRADIDQACLAIAKGDHEQAIAAYLWRQLESERDQATQQLREAQAQINRCVDDGLTVSEQLREVEREAEQLREARDEAILSAGQEASARYFQVCKAAEAHAASLRTALEELLTLVPSGDAHDTTCALNPMHDDFYENPAPDEHPGPRVCECHVEIVRRARALSDTDHPGGGEAG